jgi:Leucine-rich repeat (LRR) protein
MYNCLSSLKKLTINRFEQLRRIVSLPATLEYINLGHNRINVIEPDAFRRLNKLWKIDLENNCLIAEETFPAFAHLINLERLYLRSIKIDSLDGLQCIYLPRLRTINLHLGKVTKLSKQTFATLPGLVDLRLVFDSITEIEQSAFDGLINLRVLSLDGSTLQTFYFNVFESGADKLGSPVNLLELYLNVIESVQWSPETKMLDVDENVPKAMEENNSDADAAVSLFTNLGFRNKLDISFGKHKLHNSSFVSALAARGLIRYRYI